MLGYANCGVDMNSIIALIEDGADLACGEIRVHKAAIQYQFK